MDNFIQVFLSDIQPIHHTTGEIFKTTKVERLFGIHLVSLVAVNRSPETALMADTSNYRDLLSHRWNLGRDDTREVDDVIVKGIHIAKSASIFSLEIQHRNISYLDLLNWTKKFSTVKKFFYEDVANFNKPRNPNEVDDFIIERSPFLLQTDTFIKNVARALAQSLNEENIFGGYHALSNMNYTGSENFGLVNLKDMNISVLPKLFTANGNAILCYVAFPSPYENGSFQNDHLAHKVSRILSKLLNGIPVSHSARLKNIRGHDELIALRFFSSE